MASKNVHSPSLSSPRSQGVPSRHATTQAQTERKILSLRRPQAPNTKEAFESSVAAPAQKATALTQENTERSLKSAQAATPKASPALTVSPIKQAPQRDAPIAESSQESQTNTHDKLPHDKHPLGDSGNAQGEQAQSKLSLQNLASALCAAFAVPHFFNTMLNIESSKDSTPKFLLESPAWQKGLAVHAELKKLTSKNTKSNSTPPRGRPSLIATTPNLEQDKTKNSPPVPSALSNTLLWLDTLVTLYGPVYPKTATKLIVHLGSNTKLNTLLLATLKEDTAYAPVTALVLEGLWTSSALLAREQMSHSANRLRYMGMLQNLQHSQTLLESALFEHNFLMAAFSLEQISKLTHKIESKLNVGTDASDNEHLSNLTEWDFIKLKRQEKEDQAVRALFGQQAEFSDQDTFKAALDQLSPYLSYAYSQGSLQAATALVDMLYQKFEQNHNYLYSQILDMVLFNSASALALTFKEHDWSSFRSLKEVDSKADSTNTRAGAELETKANADLDLTLDQTIARNDSELDSFVSDSLHALGVLETGVKKHLAPLLAQRICDFTAPAPQDLMLPELFKQEFLACALKRSDQCKLASKATLEFPWKVPHNLLAVGYVLDLLTPILYGLLQRLRSTPLLSKEHQLQTAEIPHETGAITALQRLKANYLELCAQPCLMVFASLTANQQAISVEALNLQEELGEQAKQGVAKLSQVKSAKNLSQPSKRGKNPATQSFALRCYGSSLPISAQLCTESALVFLNCDNIRARLEQIATLYDLAKLYAQFDLSLALHYCALSIRFQDLLVGTTWQRYMSWQLFEQLFDRQLGAHSQSNATLGKLDLSATAPDQSKVNPLTSIDQSQVRRQQRSGISQEATQSLNFLHDTSSIPASNYLLALSHLTGVMGNIDYGQVFNHAQMALKGIAQHKLYVQEYLEAKAQAVLTEEPESFAQAPCHLYLEDVESKRNLGSHHLVKSDKTTSTAPSQSDGSYNGHDDNYSNGRKGSNGSNGSNDQRTQKSSSGKSLLKSIIESSHNLSDAHKLRLAHKQNQQGSKSEALLYDKPTYQPSLQILSEQGLGKTRLETSLDVSKYMPSVHSKELTQHALKNQPDAIESLDASKNMRDLALNKSINQGSKKTLSLKKPHSKDQVSQATAQVSTVSSISREQLPLSCDASSAQSAQYAQEAYRGLAMCTLFTPLSLASVLKSDYNAVSALGSTTKGEVAKNAVIQDNTAPTSQHEGSACPHEGMAKAQSAPLSCKDTKAPVLKPSSESPLVLKVLPNTLRLNLREVECKEIGQEQGYAYLLPELYALMGILYLKGYGTGQNCDLAEMYAYLLDKTLSTIAPEQGLNSCLRINQIFELLKESKLSILHDAAFQQRETAVWILKALAHTYGFAEASVDAKSSKSFVDLVAKKGLKLAKANHKLRLLLR